MVLEFLEYTGCPESLDANSRVVGTNRLTPSLLLVLFLKAWLWSSLLPGSSEVCPRTWSPLLCRVWAEQIHCSQKSPFHKQWSWPGEIRSGLHLGRLDMQTVDPTSWWLKRWIETRDRKEGRPPTWQRKLRGVSLDSHCFREGSTYSRETVRKDSQVEARHGKG